VIAAEGNKTERQYFALLNTKESVVNVKCLRGGHDSAPLKVLERMKKYLKRSDTKSTDEAWLVVDRDQWSEDQLNRLHRWTGQCENRNFALSNPMFEYWLLLHFEDGSGVTSTQNCKDRLKKCLPEYSKGIDPRKFTSQAIADAINRAKQRDNPPCTDWPRTVGSTTVYKLVKRILETE